MRKDFARDNILKLNSTKIVPINKDDSFVNISIKLQQLKQKLQMVKKFKSLSPATKIQQQKTCKLYRMTSDNSLKMGKNNKNDNIISKHSQNYKQIKKIETDLMYKLQELESVYKQLNNQVEKTFENIIEKVKQIKNDAINKLDEIKNNKLEMIEDDINNLITSTKSIKKRIKSNQTIFGTQIDFIKKLDSKIRTQLQNQYLKQFILNNQRSLIKFLNDFSLLQNKKSNITSTSIMQNQKIEEPINTNSDEATIEEFDQPKQNNQYQLQNQIITNCQIKCMNQINDNSISIRSLRSKLKTSQRQISPIINGRTSNPSKNYLQILQAQRTKYNETKLLMKL